MMQKIEEEAGSALYKSFNEASKTIEFSRRVLDAVSDSFSIAFTHAYGEGMFQITKMEFDREIFRKCAIVDSLMHKKPELYEINIEEVNEIPIDSSLRNLLQTEKLSEFDFKEMTKQVIEFSKRTIENLTKNEIKAIDQFFELKKLEPKLIDEKGVFHTAIRDHPAILRALT